jgi:hypothetical protein
MFDEMEEAERMLESINVRSVELIQELREYTARAKEADPTNDDRSAFEGWTIQKLAGMQVALEVLNRHIVRLGAIVTKKGR